MITPDHDSGVVPVGGGIQGVQQSAQLRIGVADAREVGLQEFIPLPVFDDPLVPCPATVRERIGQVVHPVLGQRQLVERIQIEVFLGHLPGDVRTEETDREEQRLLARLLQLPDRPIDQLVVRSLLVGNRERSTAHVLLRRLAAQWPTRGEPGGFIIDQAWPGPREQRGLPHAEIFIPRRRVVHVVGAQLQSVKIFPAPTAW